MTTTTAHMHIKRGDLTPIFVATLTDVDATGATVPVDLTDATSVHVLAWLNNEPLFDRTVVPAGGDITQGIVRMAWQAAAGETPGDTDVAGDIYIEVRVTWVSSKPQTFPPDGWMVVSVRESLTGLNDDIPT